MVPAFSSLGTGILFSLVSSYFNKEYSNFNVLFFR